MFHEKWTCDGEDSGILFTVRFEDTSNGSATGVLTMAAFVQFMMMLQPYGATLFNFTSSKMFENVDNSS
jgi:hypothetical protein